VFYFLDVTRLSQKIQDIVMVRLEQNAPFPHDLICDSLSYYPAAEAVSRRNPKTSSMVFFAAQHTLAIQVPRLPLQRRVRFTFGSARASLRRLCVLKGVM